MASQLNTYLKWILHSHVHTYAGLDPILREGDCFCVCCRLMISSRQIGKVSEKRERRPRRKSAGDSLASNSLANDSLTDAPSRVTALDSGPFDGEYLCAQCGAFGLATLWLNQQSISEYSIEQRRIDSYRLVRAALTAVIGQVVQNNASSLDWLMHLLSLGTPMELSNLNMTSYSYPAHGVLGLFYRLTIVTRADSQRAERQDAKHGATTVATTVATSTPRS